MSGWSGGRRGDRLVMKFTPTNFTPDATAGGVPSADMLAAILAGIDNALGSGASTFSGVESLELEASSFQYDSTTDLSSRTLPSSITTNAAYRDFVVLAKSGALVMENVSPNVPGATNEFRINGTTLSIHGDVTASGDTYGITYAIQ